MHYPEKTQTTCQIEKTPDSESNQGYFGYWNFASKSLQENFRIYI